MNRFFQWFKHSVVGLTIFVAICWAVTGYNFLYPNTFWRFIEPTIDTLGWLGWPVMFLLASYQLMAFGGAVWGAFLLFFVLADSLRTFWKSVRNKRTKTTD